MLRLNFGGLTFERIGIMNLKRALVASLLMLTVLSGNFVVAQSDLAEEKKAVACVDVRFKQLFESEMAKQLDLDNVMNQWTEEQGSDMPFAPEKLERFFGAISAPNSVADFMRMERDADYMAFDFFMVLQLADEESMDALFETMPYDQTIEKNGETFYLGEPEGVLIQRKNATTFAMGTEKFLLQQSFKDVFSDNLKSTWEEMDNAPVRLAVDMKTPVELLREIMEMSKQQSPPMFAPMIDVVDNAESMTLAIDPDKEGFFAFQALGIDEENAEELRGVLDGLLGMAKMAMNAEIGRMKEDAPGMAKTLQSVVDGMRAAGEGREVNIVLNKPEGLVKAFSEAVTEARSAAKRVEKMNRFRQVILGIHNYESVYMKFPLNPEATPGFHETLSWRLHLLPYLEEMALYDRLELGEAVDSDENKFVASAMPALYGTDGKNTDIVCIKPDKIPSKFAQIVDGTSNTILLLEYPKGMPWAERNDLTIDEAVELFKSLEEGESLVAGFYDGSVHNLKAGIDEDLLRKLLDPADGEVIDYDELDKWSR